MMKDIVSHTRDWEKKHVSGGEYNHPFLQWLDATVPEEQKTPGVINTILSMLVFPNTSDMLHIENDGWNQLANVVARIAHIHSGRGYERLDDVASAVTILTLLRAVNKSEEVVLPMPELMDMLPRYRQLSNDGIITINEHRAVKLDEVVYETFRDGLIQAEQRQDMAMINRDARIYMIQGPLVIA